jgi:hypothetical protein
VLKLKTPAPTLEAQIEALHNEISAIIERRAEEMRSLYDFQIPLERLVHDIKTKAWGCPCKQYLALKAEEEHGS